MAEAEAFFARLFYLTMSSAHANWQAGNRGLNLAPVIGPAA
jgi:hypothetical protein